MTTPIEPLADDLQALRRRVQTNCHISDAQYAGQHAMCVFLLKMREYFRWEQGLPFDQPLPKGAIGDWIMAREQLWNELEKHPYAPLEIGGSEIEPFDADSVNRHLRPRGLVYSGGYGQWCKPHFFLAELLEATEHHGYTVLVSGRELARDLVAPPAMTRGKRIFVRRESLRRMLWERVEEWRWQKGENELPKAMACYDFAHDLDAALEQMTDNETRALILHEVGEAMAGEELGADWGEMLIGLPRSRAELLARAARDHLADCTTTLPALLEQENQASLHFYFANLKGMRKALFPSLQRAYAKHLENASLEPLAEVTAAGKRHWRDATLAMLAGYRRDPETIREHIEGLEPSLIL